MKSSKYFTVVALKDGTWLRAVPADTCDTCVFNITGSDECGRISLWDDIGLPHVPLLPVSPYACLRNSSRRSIVWIRTPSVTPEEAAGFAAQLLSFNLK